jgi:hypothetical protein
MIRNAIIAVTAGALTLAGAAEARAQIRVEVGATGGYIFSEGIDGDAFPTPLGTFNGVKVKHGPSIGLSVGVLTPMGGEVGFLWGRQMSELSLKGTPPFVVGDMNIDNYHAYFAYNALPDAKVHPYISIGLGATDYRAVQYSTPFRSGEINGSVRFSFKFGVGIKTWANEKVGFRAAMNWTPTSVASEDNGWWCDPFYGCYVTTDHKFSNQFELAGGVVFRFGGN